MDTFSMSNSLPKGNVYESDSICGAYLEDAASQLTEGVRPEAISNEEIHKRDIILEIYRVEDNAIHGGILHVDGSGGRLRFSKFIEREKQDNFLFLLLRKGLYYSDAAQRVYCALAPDYQKTKLISKTFPMAAVASAALRMEKLLDGVSAPGTSSTYRIPCLSEDRRRTLFWQREYSVSGKDPQRVFYCDLRYEYENRVPDKTDDDYIQRTLKAFKPLLRKCDDQEVEDCRDILCHMDYGNIRREVIARELQGK